MKKMFNMELTINDSKDDMYNAEPAAGASSTYNLPKELRSIDVVRTIDEHVIPTCLNALDENGTMILGSLGGLDLVGINYTCKDSLNDKE